MVSPASPSKSPLLDSQGPRLALIADDLTGACDAGVQFARRGFATVVKLASRLSHRDNTAVICISTHSREDPPAEARSKVEKACRELLGRGRRIIFKKIDSTLRGNLGQEIDAAMKCCQAPAALVAPAFPAQGRFLESGCLRVVNQPSWEPIHLPSLLRTQGLTNVHHIPTQYLRVGAENLAGYINGQASRPKPVFVFDTKSQKDLAVIARVAAKLGRPALLVGSAGLAAEVAATLAAEHHLSGPETLAHEHSERRMGSIILALGTSHAVTWGQVCHLTGHGLGMVLPQGRKAVPSARRAMKERKHIVIPIFPEAQGRDAVQALSRILRNDHVRGIILSGGDTARFICRALRATAVKLEGEIAPGIPWGYWVGGLAGGIPVSTKAGGFGGIEALVTMTEFLATLKPQAP